MPIASNGRTDSVEPSGTCFRLRWRPGLSVSLFEELVDLVEDPRIIQGEIADRYLDLPPEVIVTVMQPHQRYVPLTRSAAGSSDWPRAMCFGLSSCWWERPCVR